MEESKIRVAFDIDGTLLDASDGPNYDVINELRWHLQHGNTIYAWSGSGVDYTRIVITKLGFRDYVYVIPKWGLQVDIAYDDQVGAKAQEGKMAKVVIIV